MSRTLWLFLLLGVAASTLIQQAAADADAEAADKDYHGDEKEDYGDEDEEEETYTGPPPVIHSKARELRAKVGETVKLPCEVEHAAHVVKIWRKNQEILWTDNIRSTQDKRLHKLADNTLEIRKVNASDEGHYKCLLGTQPEISVTHTLHILQTPRIVKLEPGPTKIIHKGQPLTLSCEATGYPVPNIAWSRKGKNLPDGEDTVAGNAITFDSVTRKHAGTYECMASNGIGDPATASVDISVQYPPEIEIDKAIVNSGEGYDAELVCEVHAVPSAKVMWKKDGKDIPQSGSDRMKVTRSGGRHILQVQNTQKSDFGSYTCHANNSLGRQDRVIRLSGEPSPAKFMSGEEIPAESPDGRGMTLEWKVESHSPITSYELRYRNKKMSEWKKLHPMVENPEGNVYTVTQDLKSLSSGHYEVILLSQNTYGWSEPSIPHLFELKERNVHGAMFGASAGLAEPSMGETTMGTATSLHSPVMALLTILSLSAFFL